MAKMAGKKKGRKVKSRPQPKNNNSLTGIVKRGLDNAAKAYAALLVDPCNAPLAYPVYGGSDGSYLIRCESYYTPGAGGGETAFVVGWTPGAIGGDGVDPDRSMLYGAAANGSAAITLVADGVQSPGAAWLRANASSYRAVAACATVMYAGAELNRSGFVGYGCINGAVLGNKYFDTETTTASEVVTTLPNGDKTPASHIEINWYPSDNDSLFHDPEEKASQEMLSRKNTIAISAQGLPAAVGMVIKFTAVYEYKPKLGTGIVQASRSTRSSNTLNDVLQFLYSAYQNPFVRQGASALLGYGRPNRVRHIEL